MQSSYYYQCTATNQCPVYVVLLSLRGICREMLLAATTSKKRLYLLASLWQGLFSAKQKMFSFGKQRSS